MMSCNTVGNVSLVIAKVEPTLSINGRHDARNALSSLAECLPLPRNRDRENSLEDSVAFDANSSAILKITKHDPAMDSESILQRGPIDLLNSTLIATYKVTTIKASTPNT